MSMPNFLIIGAAKAGTSSLYHYLKQHPQIYMSPKKELRFFSLVGEKLDFCGPGDKQLYRKNSITDLETYRSFFSGVADEIAVGEASPGYLYYPNAPENIKSYIPEAKLIAILRDPVERAYSHFLHNLRKGKEPLTDFAQAIQEEETRTQGNWSRNWHYLKTGLYYAQVKRYFNTFDRRQIKIYLYEEFSRTPLKVVQDIFSHLDVEPTFIPDVSRKYNVSGIPKNRALQAILTRENLLAKPLTSSRLGTRIVNSVKKRNINSKPPLPPEIRTDLVQMYQEDILKLQDLIKRDLTHWLK